MAWGGLSAAGCLQEMERAERERRRAEEKAERERKKQELARAKEELRLRALQEREERKAQAQAEKDRRAQERRDKLNERRKWVPALAFRRFLRGGQYNLGSLA